MERCSKYTVYDIGTNGAWTVRNNFIFFVNFPIYSILLQQYRKEQDKINVRLTHTFQAENDSGRVSFAEHTDTCVLDVFHSELVWNFEGPEKEKKF